MLHRALALPPGCNGVSSSAPAALTSANASADAIPHAAAHTFPELAAHLGANTNSYASAHRVPRWTFPASVHP